MRQSEFQKRLIDGFNGHPKRPASRAYFLARQSWRKLRAQNIALDRILCGGERGLYGEQFARHSGDLERTSMPVALSPHTEFLEQYKEHGEQIFDQESFEKTSYYRHATTCIRLFGNYFGATSEDQVIYLAKNFTALYEAKVVDNSKLSSSSGYSRPGEEIRVFPIGYSDCFQAYGGNHRLAMCCARGEKRVAVRIIGPLQWTCLQQLLLDVSWNPNKRNIYQPIESPELGKHWQLVRRCTDRLEMMEKFVRLRGLDSPRGQTYLDLGCNYGWFVRSMQDLGYQAQGLEVDWAARQIGEHFYHLCKNQLIGDEVVRFFRSNPSQYDVVSCFSLMHHFVMGRGAVKAEYLMNWLSLMTRRILFLKWETRTKLGSQEVYWVGIHIPSKNGFGVMGTSEKLFF